MFAIWDAGERKLFVARDHHGNTGLYYHADSRRFTFASSLKGLLALPDVPNRPDPLTIAKAMTSWPDFGDRTCNEGILRLLPAHALTVTAEGVEVERYWYLEETPDLRLPSDDEYLDAFLEIYREAVRCRMRCTQPLGVTLSGGLDSGSVAALAARELGKNGQRLPAFSSVPIAPTEGLVGWHVGDETPFIEATARFIGNVDVNYIDAREVSPVAAIERALFIHDQPLHGVQNMHWVIELMDGSAEAGSGCDSHRARRQLHDLMAWRRPHGPAARPPREGPGGDVPEKVPGLAPGDRALDVDGGEGPGDPSVAGTAAATPAAAGGHGRCVA